MNHHRTFDSTRQINQATARQAARTNRVLDELLQIAIEETSASHRTDANQIEKTSEALIRASLTLGEIRD